MGWFTMAAVFWGADKPVPRPGDPAPEFAKLPATAGGTKGLADFADRDVLVIAVTCNECPFAREAEPKLLAFARKYAANPRVALVAISSSQHPEDSFAEMKKRAAAKGYDFPYLHDADQAVARALHAYVTPEFFVYGKDRKLMYHGRWEEADDGAALVEPAVAALLAGRPAPAWQRPLGCPIKFAAKPK